MSFHESEASDCVRRDTHNKKLTVNRHCCSWWFCYKFL